MSGSTFTADPAVRRAIVAHARREAPNECCGFLLGRGTRILFALAVANVAASRTRYRVDDRVHIALRRTLRGLTPSLAILGVYHSHPAGSARASPTDVAEAMYPEWVSVIAGLGAGRPELRAYRIGQGRAREVRIRWEKAQFGRRRRGT